MFLKTVSPVAVHSEWRSAKSISLPLCFNDSTSDSDFATCSGSPISCKVQMIIDRLTQSSDMSEKVPADASAQFGFEMHMHGGRTPHLMDALTRPQRTDKDNGRLHTSCSDTNEDSDSDDSVDRGIEEAIQEYLKEKVDHNCQRDPKGCTGQRAQVQCGGTCIPDSPKQLLHMNKASSDIDLKGSTGIQSLLDLKEKSSKENQCVKTPRAKTIPPKAITCSWAQRDSTSCLPYNDKTAPHIKLKLEQDDFESSSDDGIEEAIQKFQQMEKDRHESLKFDLHQDSSSDDGIEEAIQHYQQEKEHQSKPSLQLATQHTNIQPNKNLMKKNCNNRKKNVIKQRETKCFSPRHLKHQLNMSDCLKAGKPFAEQQIHSTLMVTTTAELMCAEAILDISKTVMPATFEPTVNLAKSSLSEAPFLFSHNLPQPDEKTDESSVDSEDGIELEIRKFLEHKAKLHEHEIMPTSDCTKLLSGSKAPQNKNMKDQRKELRLSLSRKRKHREVDGRNDKEIVGKMFKRETHSKDTLIDPPVIKASTSNTVLLKHCKSPSSLREYTKDKDTNSIFVSTLTSSGTLKCIRDNSSDKSSSFDSDEDLDTAIKDLLKTKKKVKKKKMKTQNCLMAAQSPDKKQKSVTSKLLKTLKSRKSSAQLTGPDKNIAREIRKTPKQKLVTEPVKGQHRLKMVNSLSSLQHLQVEGDASSVDSDDSIEQEIRRFLAEKAKVSPMPSSVVTENKAKETVSPHEVKSVKIEKNTFDSGFQHTEPMLLQEQQQQNTSAPIIWPRPFYNNKVETEVPTLTNYCVKKVERTDGHVENALYDQINNSLDTLDIDTASEAKERRDRHLFASSVMCAKDPQEPGCQTPHHNLFLMKPENFTIDNVRETTSLDLSSSNSDRTPLKEVISTVCLSPLVNKPSSLPIATPRIAREHWASLTDSFDQDRTHNCVQRGQWDQPTCMSRHSSSTPPHQSVQTLSNPSHLSCASLPLSLSQPRFGASVKRPWRDQVTVLAQPAVKTNHVQLINIQEESQRISEVKEEKQENCIDETDVESGEERRETQR